MTQNILLRRVRGLRGLLVVILFVASAASAQTAAEKREQAQLVFDRAKALAAAEQYDAAALLFEESYKLDGSWSKPLVNAALCRRRGGNFDAAKDTYRRVLKAFKDEPSALFGLAETERLSGNNDAARDLFLRYLVVENRKGQEKLIDYASRQVAALKDKPDTKPAAPAPAPAKTPAPAAPAPAPAPTPKPNPIPVQGRPGASAPPARTALDHQTLLVLDPAARGVSATFVRQYNRILKEELVKAGGLSVHHPDEAIGHLVKTGQPVCNPQPVCLAPVMGAGVMLRSDLKSERDRVRITLTLVRTKGEAKIGEVSGTVQGEKAVTRFVREALSDLLAQHALAAQNEDVPAAEPSTQEPDPPAEGRRLAADNRPAADAADAGAPADDPAPRRRMITDGDNKPSGLRAETKPAVVEPDEGMSGTTIAKHVWRWGFVACGVTVAGAGLAADVLMPTSANYKLDAADFILPGAVASGVVLGLVGVFVNPFSWLE